MAEITNAYNIFVGKPELKKPLGSFKPRCVDKITTYRR
jgi:hypothetical protein